MEYDWDLQAVVRSCSYSAITTTAPPAAVVYSTPTTATNGCQSSSNPEQDCNFTWCKDPFEAGRSSFIEDLHQLWKPFSRKQQNLPVSPLSVLQDLPSSDQKPLPPKKQQFFSVVNGSKPSTTGPRSKKRKYHSKKVCHVAAENLSSDKWSWRKYGQKPIKGSPYPRGYYKCSTLKGCMARKQVERNRSDPGMFIVTYSGEHSHPIPTHRNSLAGSTRQKPASSDPKAPPEKMESSREDLAGVEEEDDDEDDDFFAGLEDFAGDSLPENSQFPWNGGTTTAVGGG